MFNFDLLWFITDILSINLGSIPYIGIKLTAAKKSSLDTVQNIGLITPAGEILHKYPINSSVEDGYIISTDDFRMPSEPFYLQLEGIDTSIGPIVYFNIFIYF